MNEPHESVDQNVKAIFRELVGDRVSRLDGARIAEPAMSTMADALAGDYEPQTAHDIAFHMADWNSDAAFIVAVHLFPERFTPEEIRDGIGRFLVHAPNHIREACRLTGQYVWESFPDEDEQSGEWEADSCCGSGVSRSEHNESSPRLTNGGAGVIGVSPPPKSD